MKQKLLRITLVSVVMMLMGVGNAFAADPDLTLDFTSAWTAQADSDGEKVFTSGDYTISGQGDTNFKFNGGYFFFGKSGAYVKLPKVDFAVAKIEVVGRSGASGSVVHNIFVGETAVSTAVTGLAGTTSTFEIGASYQAANTQYILKVTSNHNAQVTYVKYYKAGAADPTIVATPTITPPGGTYNSTQNVTISCATAGATIRYTINGGDPTESDAIYSSAIPVTVSGTIIKAKAFKSEMTASSVATATYIIKPNKPTITAAGATVTITGDDGCTFYYTTNGDAPDKTKTKYNAPFDLDADCTIKAIAYDANNNASDVTSLPYKYMPLAPKNINSNYFVKVTDVSTLENGDAILIVNEDGNVAMSTTQNSNNRAQADVTISGETIVSPEADVQKLVLVKKTETISSVDTEVFYFYTGIGYLYAASGSSNHLKTEETPDNNNNARATISISEGNATITFRGTNTNNLLKYNSTSSIFSCYGSSSSQSPVQIYKEVEIVPVTITTADYATFCSAVDLDFSETGITVYQAKVESNKVKFTEVSDGLVPAYTGVLLYKDVDAESVVNVPVTTGVAALSENELVGVTAETAVAYNPDTDVYNYILQMDGANLVFRKATGAKLRANRAYLSTSYDVTAPGARELEVSFGDETAINALENVTKIDNGAIYDLSGRRVENPTKGIYIMNGKKVIFK